MPAKALSSLLLLLLSSVASGELLVSRNPETGLQGWLWRGNGVEFELNQRLPDQTRAFFLARGFDAASADRFATSCVFQSRFLNSAPAQAGTVTIDLTRWRVVRGEARSPLLVREHWSPLWRQAGLGKAARIAFDWSLLPTRQSYDSGDYNWGMTSYGLPPGSRFDLEFEWRRNGEPFTGRIEGIECATDPGR